MLAVVFTSNWALSHLRLMKLLIKFEQLCSIFWNFPDEDAVWRDSRLEAVMGVHPGGMRWKGSRDG